MKHYTARHYQENRETYMANQRSRRSTPEGREQKRMWARMRTISTKEACARSGETKTAVWQAIHRGHLKVKKGRGPRGEYHIDLKSFEAWIGLTDFTPTPEDQLMVDLFKKAARVDSSYLTEVLWDAREFIDEG